MPVLALEVVCVLHAELIGGVWEIGARGIIKNGQWKE